MCDENEFELNGTVYIAVNAPTPEYFKSYTCGGCAFEPRDVANIGLCWAVGNEVVPNCHGRKRSDGRSVIFVERQS